MAQLQNASFIPKSPQKARSKPRARRRIYILSYVSYVVFFGTLLATIGTYFYQLNVQRDLDQQLALLIEEKKAFNQADIDRVRQLDKQFSAIDYVLKGTYAPSSIFELLEDTTVETIQVIDFTYEKGVFDNYSVEISAKAGSFDEALIQRNALQSAMAGAGGFDLTYTYGTENVSSEPSVVAPLLQLGDPSIIFTFNGSFHLSTIPYDVSVYETVTASQARPAGESVVNQVLDEVVVETEVPSSTPSTTPNQ